MNDVPRRTQKERREATIAKLLEATIECLMDVGYRDTSISRICERAGVSHGGLFRHFASRNELVAAATNAIGQQHIARFRTLVDALPATADLPENLVTMFRQAARSPLTAAWREVLLAARTNEPLRDAIMTAVQNFEDAIMDAVSQLTGARSDTRAFGTLVLSLLHMFDSEATTVTVLETEDVLKIRHDWAVMQLTQALESPK